jgi:hypothetical protein
LDFHWILKAYSLTCTWKIYCFSFPDKMTFEVVALLTTWVKSATYAVTSHTHTHKTTDIRLYTNWFHIDITASVLCINLSSHQVIKKSAAVIHGV